jgi:hypothetical protein
VTPSVSGHIVLFLNKVLIYRFTFFRVGPKPRECFENKTFYAVLFSAGLTAFDWLISIADVLVFLQHRSVNNSVMFWHIYCIPLLH